MSARWNTNIFSDYCAGSGCNCCFGTFLQPCAAASIKSHFDGSSWSYSLWWLCSPCPIISCCNYSILRNYVRTGYGIEGTAAQDCCLSTFCTPCVLTQMLNEVSSRGRYNYQRPITVREEVNEIRSYALCDIFMSCLCCYCEVSRVYANELKTVRPLFKFRLSIISLT